MAPLSLAAIALVMMPTVAALPVKPARAAFLGTSLQPAQIARLLVGVQDEWKLLFTSCASADNSTSAGLLLVECRRSPSAFAKYCEPIVQAVTEGRSGDRSVVEAYMKDICAQDVLQGSRHDRCIFLANTIVSAIWAKNGGALNKNKVQVCTDLWSQFSADEQFLRGGERKAQAPLGLAAGEAEAAAKAKADLFSQAQEAGKAKAKADEAKAKAQAGEAAKSKAPLLPYTGMTCETNDHHMGKRTSATGSWRSDNACTLEILSSDVTTWADGTGVHFHEWARITLASSTVLSSAEVYYFTSQTCDYNVQYSTDGSTWETACALTSESSGTNACTSGFPSTGVSYLRIHKPSDRACWGQDTSFRLTGMKLYGHQATELNTDQEAKKKAGLKVKADQEAKKRAGQKVEAKAKAAKAAKARAITQAKQEKDAAKAKDAYKQGPPG